MTDNAYVQVVEPKNKRICLRGCMDEADCDLSHDTSGESLWITHRYGARQLTIAPLFLHQVVWL